MIVSEIIAGVLAGSVAYKTQQAASQLASQHGVTDPVDKFIVRSAASFVAFTATYGCCKAVINAFS